MAWQDNICGIHVKFKFKKKNQFLLSPFVPQVGFHNYLGAGKVREEFSLGRIWKQSWTEWILYDDSVFQGSFEAVYQWKHMYWIQTRESCWHVADGVQQCKGWGVISQQSNSSCWYQEMTGTLGGWVPPALTIINTTVGLWSVYTSTKGPTINDLGGGLRQKWEKKTRPRKKTQLNHPQKKLVPPPQIDGPPLPVKNDSSLSLLPWHKVCQLGGDEIDRPPVVALSSWLSVTIASPSSTGLREMC